jgi:hypothetical protein
MNPRLDLNGDVFAARTDGEVGKSTFDNFNYLVQSATVLK